MARVTNPQDEPMRDGAADPGTGREGTASPPVPAGDPPGTPTPSPPSGTPLYKGEPLDAERGPGLGCFWTQVIVLGVLLVLTPLTVVWGAPSWVSATLLIVTLVLLLFAGQTVIFLLRLVAADRRSRRRPLGSQARRTVGMLEDERDGPEAPPSDPT
jgi:hypothetical protein